MRGRRTGTLLLPRIRLLEYVRARRYATTGRIGLGLDRTAWAVLRSIGSSRDSTEHLMGASRGPDLVGPAADPRIFLPAHDDDWDGSPGRVMRHSTRPLPSPPAHRAAAQARSPAGSRSPAGDCWRTKRSNGHVMLSCKGLCEGGRSRVWASAGSRRLLRFNQHSNSFKYCRCRPCRGV